MAEIVWTAQAAECLDQVFGWIEKDNREAAVGVVTGIYSKVQLLKNQPRIGSRYLEIEDREVREILYGHYRIPFDSKRGTDRNPRCFPQCNADRGVSKVT